MRLVTRLVTAVLVVAAVYVLVTFLQVWWTSLRDDAGPAGAIVVLGAAQYDGRPSPVFAARLDHAADLHDAGVAPVIVVTGGSRPGDRYTEAAAGAAYLRRRGVPDRSLRLEVQGANSWESIAATARFLREEGITEVVLVSSSYHSYRIADIADEQGLSAAVSPVGRPPTGFAGTARALARETAAVALGRIVGYRRLTVLDRYLHPAADLARTAAAGRPVRPLLPGH